MRWKGCWWFVSKISPDRESFECRQVSGYTSTFELLDDPRVEARLEPWDRRHHECWATLTPDDVDELVINEVEVVKSRRDESTVRRIYSWRSPEASHQGI
mgnify:FL=1